MRSSSIRARERISKLTRLIISYGMPQSMQSAAMRCADASALAYLKQPVSVAIPV